MEKPKVENPYLNKSEVARRLGVCFKTVDMMIGRKQLRGVFIGERWKISVLELNRQMTPAK